MCCTLSSKLPCLGSCYVRISWPSPAWFSLHQLFSHTALPHRAFLILIRFVIPMSSAATRQTHHAGLAGLLSAVVQSHCSSPTASFSTQPQVIGGYYSRITLARLAQMLDLTADEVRCGFLACVLTLPGTCSCLVPVLQDTLISQAAGARVVLPILLVPRASVQALAANATTRPSLHAEKHLLASSLLAAYPPTSCLHCSLLQAEKHLSDLVVGGSLAAKIDRPAGVIRFSHRT